LELDALAVLDRVSVEESDAAAALASMDESLLVSLDLLRSLSNILSSRRFCGGGGCVLTVDGLSALFASEEMM